MSSPHRTVPPRMRSAGCSSLGAARLGGAPSYRPNVRCRWQPARCTQAPAHARSGTAGPARRHRTAYVEPSPDDLPLARLHPASAERRRELATFAPRVGQPKALVEQTDWFSACGTRLTRGRREHAFAANARATRRAGHAAPARQIKSRRALQAEIFTNRDDHLAVRDQIGFTRDFGLLVDAVGPEVLRVGVHLGVERLAELGVDSL